MKKKRLILILIGILISCGIYFGYNKYQQHLQILKEKKEQYIAEVTSHFATQVKVVNHAVIYENIDAEFVEIGNVGTNEIITLVETEIDENTTHFFSDSLGYYIAYSDVTPHHQKVSYSSRHKLYIPFNQSILAQGNIKLYNDNMELAFDIPLTEHLPIIINEEKVYGVDYQDRLLWVKKDSQHEVIDITNSELKKATRVRVLCYHRVYEKLKECKNRVICHSLKQMRSHFKYIKDKGYLTMTMQEMYWYIHGKANMPYRSVLLTFDDGGGINHLVSLLQEYELNATAFIIAKNYDEYLENLDRTYLELHSHSYAMHTKGHCSFGKFGSAVVCKKYETVLADLIKSKEVLGDPIAFCYPYYEYTSKTMKIVAEAGFLLAFEDNTGFTRIGSNPYKISRYTFLYDATVADLKYVLGEK